jgi:hypothetical protein
MLLNAKILLLILCFAVYAAAETYKVSKVNVLKGRTLTVIAPCDATPVFDPDVVAVEGRGRVVTIYPYDSATVSLICKDGDSGYVVDINVQSEPSSDQKNFLEITDEEYIKKKRKGISAAAISSYDKEQILSEARGVLVAMLNSAEASGYETNEGLNSPILRKGDLSARLIKAYTGALMGHVYEITNKSKLKVRKNVREFSAKGVIYIYSPALLDNGDIVIPASGKTIVYIVKTDITDDGLRTVMPWVGSSTSAQANAPLPVALPPPPADTEGSYPAGGYLTQPTTSLSQQMQYPVQETLQSIQTIDMNQVVPFLRDKK